MREVKAPGEAAWSIPADEIGRVLDEIVLDDAEQAASIANVWRKLQAGARA